ncbi:MAG: ParA family protein [Methylococcaceae bacterium]
MSVRIIAIINQKGGVGKTTTTANLTYALAKVGKKVTVIDFDPQGHLAISLGLFSKQHVGIDAVMLGEASLEEVIIPMRENLQLVPAGTKLQDIELLNDGGVQRGDLLRKALSNSFQDQDFVFIDCPPSSGLLVANVLFATEEILIPMASDFMALQGLSHLMETIRKFEKVLKKTYKTQLVISRYTASRRLSKEVVAKLQHYFPKQILATVIRETALLAECPSFGKTILEYRPSSPSARDFHDLASDFLIGKVM